MTTAPAPPNAPPSASPDWWTRPLLAGICFGIGYGVVQRLMVMEFSQLVQLGQAFEVREFPGTSLEAIRLRTGTKAQSIRGDLGVLELEEPQEVRPSEPSPDPAPLITPRPAERQRFSEPLDGFPDPEPVPMPPEPVPLPELPPPGMDQVTP